MHAPGPCGRSAPGAGAGAGADFARSAARSAAADYVLFPERDYMVDEVACWTCGGLACHWAPVTASTLGAALGERYC
eukprot:SAG22_NODE_355_length_11775_cov_76.400651_12_plen_77_part_00